jgi:chemotaxis protein MotA
LEVAVFRDFVLLGVLAFALIAAAIFKPQFFNPLSLFFICGGALAVVGFSYSGKQLRDCARAIRGLFARPQTSLQVYTGELRRLTELFRLRGLRGMESQEKHLNDAYLKYSVELLVDLHNAESIRARMEHRLTEVLGEDEVNRQILLTLGKLLPSFGLIGTLVGMVMVLGNLANQDAQSLPASLGLALLTTLYGAVAANVLVAPLLARLQATAVEREMKMRVTMDWVQMIVKGNNAALADSSNLFNSTVAEDRSWLPHWAALGLPVQR